MTTEIRRPHPVEHLRPQLIISADDSSRLDRCVAAALDTRLAPEAEELEVELARARVVPANEVPADVVTMGSSLVIADQGAGTQRAMTLVYPEEANAAAGLISVLAPIGAAVIGVRAGDEIDWCLPNGRTTRLRILEVTHQPQVGADAGR